MPILKTLRTLISYLLVAFFLLTPFGWIFLAQLPFIGVSRYCHHTWYVIDILVCHVCHNTGPKRTISGWTGQYMNSKKRYRYQSRVIDFMFGKGHCWQEYQHEKSKGYVLSEA